MAVCLDSSYLLGWCGAVWWWWWQNDLIKVEWGGDEKNDPKVGGVCDSLAQCWVITYRGQGFLSNLLNYLFFQFVGFPAFVEPITII